MILFLDSSAAVKLYSTEEHRGYVEDVVRRVGGANVGIVAVSAIAQAEVSAALAAMARAGRITPEHYESAMGKLASDLADLYLVRPVTARVIRRASALPAPVLGTPGRHKLKGYDAVQLATALELRDELIDRAVAMADPSEVEPGQPIPMPPPEPTLVLSFDDDLFAACVAESIAHARPDRAGGNTFPAP